ncbi:MAG TPA: hypothetical protein DCP32_11675 [Anaerolineaceae bacterium]|nr:hypothetical protein [Anaerolineaceae bacterium]
MIPPRILAILPGFVASTIMDVVKPLMRLDAQGAVRFDATLEFYPSSKAIKKADLVIFCRNTDPRFRHHLDSVYSISTPFIYDLDDNFFEVPLDTVSGEYHRNPSQLECLEQYIRQAALVRVYSKELQDRLATLDVNSSLMSPPLNWELISTRKPAPESKPIKIVYATSRKEDPLSALFIEALTLVQKTNPEDVEIHFWGQYPNNFVQSSNVKFHPFLKNYDKFLLTFSEQEYDIGLAPLIDDPFHRSKTNNKYREYGACEIAGIYSNVPVYADFVKNLDTGILVENTVEDWYSALMQLINDPDLRRRIGLAARQDVLKRYPPGHFENDWANQIKHVLGQSGKEPTLQHKTEIHTGTIQTAQQRPADKPGSVIKSLAKKSLADWKFSFHTQLFNLVMMFKINFRKKL